MITRSLDDYRAWRRSRRANAGAIGFEVDPRDLHPRMRDDQRAINLWTSCGDVVLDPFAGIGSVPGKAVEMGRIGIGFELKESYYRYACKYAEDAERLAKTGTLFDGVGE